MFTANAIESLNLIDTLLRDRQRLMEMIKKGESSGTLAQVMLLTILFSSAAFGATLGGFRGGIQIFYAALKVPMVLLFTLGLSAPCFSTLNMVVHGKLTLRQDLTLLLSALAISSLLNAALAPIILLAITLLLSYHDIYLLVVLCVSLSAFGGGYFLFRALGDRGPKARWLFLPFLAVVTVVGSQMGWTLRPYLVRPRTQKVPFVRSVEGNFIGSVVTSLASSQGIFRNRYAPLPGESRTRRRSTTQIPMRAPRVKPLESQRVQRSSKSLKARGSQEPVKAPSPAEPVKEQRSVELSKERGSSKPLKEQREPIKEPSPKVEGEPPPSAHFSSELQAPESP